MNLLTLEILDSKEKEGGTMGVWAALVFGICVGTILAFYILFLDYTKKQNNETQNINNEIQCMIDNMSPRELYIHKVSQNNLVWDEKTNTYIKKME